VIRILAYGDSNTWGFLPIDPKVGVIERLEYSDRWTGVASEILGREYLLLEDALPGRTLGAERPDMATGGAIHPAAFNGHKEILPAIVRNAPLNGVIVVLGTNDLLMEPEIGVTIFLGRVEAMVRRIQDFKLPAPLKGMDGPPWVLIVAPPALTTNATSPNAQHAEEKRATIAQALIGHAVATGYYLADAASVIKFLEGDGVHLDGPAHQKLGALIAQAITTAVASPIVPASG
jgi:lysophospholipase L1-like esterase